MKTIRTLLAAGMIVLAAGFAADTPALAADAAAPSATLELASEQMRLIMGGTAGKGVLHFGGRDYGFTFKTASAGIGAKAVKEVSAKGEVYGLQSLDDFAGKYRSVTRTALAGSSEVQAKYENDKGVVLELRGTVKGVGLSLGGGMATIELVQD